MAATPENTGNSGGDLYDDAALREEISRLIAEEMGDSGELDKKLRLEALKTRIMNNEYMSDQMLENIVDRLLQKWRL